MVFASRADVMLWFIKMMAEGMVRALQCLAIVDYRVPCDAGNENFVRFGVCTCPAHSDQGP